MARNMVGYLVDQWAGCLVAQMAALTDGKKVALMVDKKV